MIDKIEQYASLKFGDDKEAIAEFVAGFTKEASMLESMLKSKTDNKGENIQTTVLKGIGSTVGQGVGNLLVTAGIASAGGMINSVKGMALHSKFLQALERAYQTNTILKQAPKEKVLQYAETIFKFAPNISTDSNILSSVLANAIHGEGIYPDTIKMLTDIESRYAENTSFNPKTYSK